MKVTSGFILSFIQKVYSDLINTFSESNLFIMQHTFKFQQVLEKVKKQK